MDKSVKKTFHGNDEISGSKIDRDRRDKKIKAVSSERNFEIEDIDAFIFGDIEFDCIYHSEK